VRWQNGLGSHWNWEMSASWQTDVRQEWDLHKPINAELAAKNLPQLDYTLRTLNADALLSREAGAWGRGQWGASYLAQENVYDGRAFVPNYRMTSVGSFGFWGHRLGAWSTDLGLRVDHVQLDVWRRVSSQVVARNHSWQNLSGSWGVQVQPTNGLQIRSGLSSGWRAPMAVELWANGVHHGAASVERGDSTLGAERSLTGQASVSVHWDHWELESGVWGTYVNDWIGLVPDSLPVLTVRGAFPSYHYRATNAQLQGADLKLGWEPWEWMSGELKGNWIRVRDHRDQAMPFSPVPTAQLALYAQKEYWLGGRDWKLGPEVTYRSRGEEVANDYAPPPNDVVLWGAHASVGGEWPWCWDLVLAGENLLDTRWKDPADRLRYFASRPGRSWKARLALRF
jgi:iron complex outermembrane receptor protein